MKKGLIFALLIFVCHWVNAQDDHIDLRRGNKAYEKQNYSEAEKHFEQGVKKKPNSLKSQFNLGDAYFKQKKYNEAASTFEKITKMKASNDTLSAAYHNLGNSYLQQYIDKPNADSTGQQNIKTLESAIDAYKQALLRKPSDEDTRTNLSYAYKYLKKEQDKNKDQKKDQNKDKNKDKDKKDQNKKDQDKKDQNKDKNKDKDKKDQNKDQQNQQQKNSMSKEDAKRLLDATSNDEKNTQDKLKNEKALQGKKIQIEKDW